MTKEEFEKGYAERSGTTVERLHQLGQHAEPCDCGDLVCQGWKMVSALNDFDKTVLFFNEMGVPFAVGDRMGVPIQYKDTHAASHGETVYVEEGFSITAGGTDFLFDRRGYFTAVRHEFKDADWVERRVG